jgi:AcrR family transcriptional regulator
LEKRDIQISRMMQYFIDATVQIIEEEGIENVTTRKIADIAGYNSATIYNYFGELSHLIFFAAMKSFKKYTDALLKYMAPGKNPLERYLLLWECFCIYSFKEPQIYHAIFSSNLGGQPEELLNRYYDYFPSDLGDPPEELIPMLLESNLTKRGIIAIKKCVEGGYIKEENVEEIIEMSTLIWLGTLTLILNNRRSYTVEEATEITMKYIKKIIFNSNQINS